MTTPSDLPDRCCECDCPMSPVGTPLGWKADVSGVVNYPNGQCLECGRLNTRRDLIHICLSMPGRECDYGDCYPVFCDQQALIMLYGDTEPSLPNSLVIWLEVRVLNPEVSFWWKKVLPSYDGSPIEITHDDFIGVSGNETVWCDWTDATIRLTPYY